MNVRCKNENAAKFCVSVGENCVTKILIRYSTCYVLVDE